ADDHTQDPQAQGPQTQGPQVQGPSGQSAEGTFGQTPQSAPGSFTPGSAVHLPPLPADALIIVPVRNMVLFPGVVLPITIGRPRSVAAAQQAVRDERPVGILMQRNAEATDPLPIDMHRMGTVANIA